MPPPMPYWPEDTDPAEDVPAAADARDQPRDVHWPDKARPDGPPPTIGVTVRSGRYPYFPGVLKPENFHVQVEGGWEPGLYLVRLDDEAHDDFHLQMEIRLPR